MTEDQLDIETAFSLLADDIRVAIITELGDATATPETGIPRLTYVELKSRVDVRDSGRFNYHLSKLVGNYVAKEDDGYRLRWPGMVLYRTLVAGLFTDGEPTFDRFPVGTDCHRCGDPIEATLYETRVRVRCWSCEVNYADIYVPSHGLADRSHEAVLRTVHRRSRTIRQSMTDGQCPWCASAVRPEVRPGEDALPSNHDTRDLAAFAIYHCTDCTGFQYMPVSQRLLYHPATISFYHDHGRDLTSIPKWEIPWAVTDATTTVTATDPWAFSVRVPVEDEELIVELDEALSVVHADRRRTH